MAGQPEPQAEAQASSASDSTPHIKPCSSASSSKIKVQVLLNTGARTALLVDPNSTIGHMKDDLVQHWPSDFGEPAPRSRLKLLNMGKIPEDHQGLKELHIDDGHAVHLFIRPESVASLKQSKPSGTSGQDGSPTSSRCCIVS